MFFTELQSNFFLKSLNLFLKLRHPADLLTSKYDFFHKNGRFSIFREVQSLNAVWYVEVEP